MNTEVPTPSAFSLPLSEAEYQFADTKALETFLNNQESVNIITGIGYYLDKKTKQPSGNYYEYTMLEIGESRGQPLSVVEVTEPHKWGEFAENHADDFAFVDHTDVIVGGKVTEVALLRKLAQPFPKIQNWSPSEDAKPLVAKVLDIAGSSDLAAHKWWKGQDKAPLGYTKGMALVFARAYCKLLQKDAVAKEMARTTFGEPTKDALAYFAQPLATAGLPKSGEESATLRQLFTVLIGLGMPESSGNYWEGKDANAHNETAETCEAGLFQTSWNARKAGGNEAAGELMVSLFKQYQASPTLGMLAVFQEGVKIKNRPSWGTGDGFLFQQYSKSCPAFAAEFTAVGLRNVRKHWGTIQHDDRGKGVGLTLVEITPKCAAMLKAVQAAVDEQFKTKPVQV